ncbi:MAG: hypothetical protein ACKO3B_11620, partial [Bacteroidota bacterium]
PALVYGPVCCTGPPFTHGDHVHYNRVIRQKGQEMAGTPASEQDWESIMIPELTFTGKVAKSLPLYASPDNGITWWWLGAIPLILSVGLFLKRKKPTTLPHSSAVVTDHAITFQGMDYQLSPTAVAVLRLLLARDEEVPSAELMKVLGKPDLDYASQVRAKNQVIRSVNLELRAIFRIAADPIQQSVSPTDRRIKCYRFDHALFNGVKFILS